MLGPDTGLLSPEDCCCFLGTSKPGCGSLSHYCSLSLGLLNIPFAYFCSIACNCECALSFAVGIEKDLHRPEARTMPGHSGVLFIALHHQTWGLLLSSHHVPLFFDAPRQFLPPGVTFDFPVLPGKGQGLYATFPDPGIFCISKTPLAPFMREHHHSNALLGQQGPHKAIERVLGNVNPFPSPWSIFYQSRCILPIAKESPTTSHCVLQQFHAHRVASHYPLQVKTEIFFPINIICRYSKFQSQLLTTDVRKGEELLETHIPNFSPVLCHSTSWWTQDVLNMS